MKYVFFIIVFCTLNFTNGQSCKVKVQAISPSYHGDCKSGLAHGQGEATGVDTYNGNFKKGFPDGQGIYTWKNGDEYQGEWKKGMKEGQGTLTKSDGSVKSGFWKKDQYLGKYEQSYKKLDKSSNVSSYSLNAGNYSSNVIRFYLKVDQKQVNSPAISVVVHNGNYSDIITTGLYAELRNVIFPFKAKVYFDQEFIEFEIFNDSAWNVTINITNILGLNNN
jgi:hypothetical protein